MRRKAKETKPTVVTPVLFDTYMALIENSVASRTFQSSFNRVDGVERDILRKDNLKGCRACAFFVSSILVIVQAIDNLQVQLIDSVHATVEGTMRDIERYWKQAWKLRRGAILLWEPMELAGEINRHIGFYVGKGKAISNDWESGVPAYHHWTYGRKEDAPFRRVVAIYHHDALMRST